MDNSFLKIEKVLKNIFFTFFLILISGYILLPKIFPKLKLNIGPLPIYITEIFISLSILVIAFLVIKNRFKIEKIHFFYLFLFFFSIFILALSFGFYNYKDLIYVLRQSALFYYGLFYFIIFYLFDGATKVNYLIMTILISSNLLIIIFVARYIGVTTKLFGSLAQYMIGGGYYFPIAILLILEINLIEIVNKKYLKILILLDILALIILSLFENVRGNWLAIAVAVIFSFILSKDKKKLIIYFLIVVLVLVAVSAIFLIFFPDFLKDTMKLENTINEIESLKSIYTKGSFEDQNVEEANINWRTLAWKEFAKEFLKRPLLGWGFGRKFIPSGTLELGWTTGLVNNYVLTHNFILAFLNISGVVGLFSFGLIIVKFFTVNIEFLRNTSLIRERRIVSAFLSCIIYILVLGLLEVVLEIPYQGVFLWVFFAFNILIIKKVSSQVK